MKIVCLRKKGTMIEVQVNIDIIKPQSETFAFISNFENNPIWQKGMQQCTIITPGVFGIGTQYQQVAKFLGKHIISKFEVIEYIPGNLVKATSLEGSFPITFTRTVEGDEHISRVKAKIEGDPKGFFKIAQPLMQWMVNRTIQQDYKRLKKILEAH